MLYKPSEVSVFLDMPSSTLRRYARLFKKYLSPTGQLHRRKYTTQDIEIFEKIKTLSAEGIPIDDIGPLLDEMPIEHEPIESQDSQDRAIMPVNPEVIKQFTNMDDKLDQVLERLERMENSPSFWDRILGRNKPPA